MRAGREIFALGLDGGALLTSVASFAKLTLWLGTHSEAPRIEVTLIVGI